MSTSNWMVQQLLRMVNP